MEECGAKGKKKATEDALFLERLEMLYEQSLSDLRAFADREGRPFDEVRRRMAEIHAKYLFDHSADGPSSSSESRKELIRRVLLNVSEQLQSLETIAGLQSFFLVVDPRDQRDEGFLGGTVLGREFWRGHRGGGSSGARLFKARCQGQAWPSSHPTAATTGSILPLMAASPLATQATPKGSARELKAALYAAMRDALRKASGIRNAEMKWTNHSKLDVYGVRIVGWPDQMPLQNPSSLSVAQNQLVFNMLGSGRIRFERLDGGQAAGDDISDGSRSFHGEEDAMFEDSIDYSWAFTDYEHDAPQVLRESADHYHTSTSAADSRCDDDRLSGILPKPGSSPDAGAKQIPEPITPKKRHVDET
ncbi:hypothetical protein BN946_scf185015.g51 [Trametes cinnabarina]|uniref:Uncharacterized protein n=1 Tax=Pycnoporus cinnabarinus TaxID=5643 RepID=A0A060SMS1_PYCCI|nr:hypothetical protein BN946_scf185015.g51 [Trametes cinnabarina]